MNSSSTKVAHTTGGFTLMEVLTVVVAIGLLSVMIFGSFSILKAKAERAKCESNLRGLYAAASAYVADYGYWPQISTKGVGKPPYAQAWVDAFAPYKISREGWICPTIQYTMGNPFYAHPEAARVDYIGTPFNSERLSSSRFPTHPWFVERGDLHGSGNLILFANGQIKSMSDVRKDTKKQILD